jgi:RNA polymerase sigma-70 factor (ECF subfamily)
MSESASSVLRQSRKSSISSDQVQEYLWVKLSRQGDALAFNRLVLKWETTIYNMAYRMLRDREEAAEATQEVFLLAFKNIRSFRQNSKFSTWLCRIAINYCVSRLKQRPPGTHLSLENQNITTGSTKQLQIPQTQFSSLMRSEQRDRIMAAICSLSPDQRVVVELKFFQEMTFEDIATTLETPLSTIKSRLYAGLEMLKIRLGDKA